jgi:hypothetical protein
MCSIALCLYQTMKVNVMRMETFFRNYERYNNHGEIDVLVSQFADVFMVAGAPGAKTVQVNAFAHALPGRKKLFNEMGCQSTKLTSLRETKMNDQYVMAETEWQMTFTQTEKSPSEIRVVSTFIVYTGGEQPKIVFYLPHHDVMAVLRERGIGV